MVKAVIPPEVMEALSRRYNRRFFRSLRCNKGYHAFVLTITGSRPYIPWSLFDLSIRCYSFRTLAL